MLAVDRLHSRLLVHGLRQRSKLVPWRRYRSDRLAEWLAFWGESRAHVDTLLKRFHSFKSQAFLDYLTQGLAHGIPSQDRLFEYYENLAKDGSLRTLVAQDGFHWFKDSLAWLRRRFQGLGQKENGLHVLDYGCGVSDAGLAFALQGCSVSIADLKTPSLDLAEWRYRRRGFSPERIEITLEKPLPELGTARYDIALNLCIWEHVIQPRKLLENMAAAIKPGGVLVCNTPLHAYQSKTDELHRDHLPETEKTLASPGFQQRFNVLFEQVPELGIVYVLR